MHRVLTGTSLEGRYRVGRVVAEGGFSVVYAGEHLTLGIPIAIKALKQRHLSSPERNESAVDRFLAEGRLVARIEHPHIVRVFDTGVWRGDSEAGPTPWLVLEWLEGQSLKDYLAARRGHEGGSPPSVCLPWIRALFTAVAHAHRAGVTHRDIKPSNVFLVRDRAGMTPKLLDFGIAKLSEPQSLPESGDTVTEEAFRAFSKHYAAPEQLAGARTGPWTDAHGLGLLITELLTDTPPYAATDAAELGQLIFDQRRPTPARFGVDVGPWEPILGELLAVRSRERTTDLLAVLERLARSVDAADAAWQPRPLTMPARPSDSATLQPGQTQSLLATAAAPRRSRSMLVLISLVGVALATAVLARQRDTIEPVVAPAGSSPLSPAPTAPTVAPYPEALAARAPQPVDSALPKADSAARRTTPKPASQPTLAAPSGERVLSVAPWPSASGAAAVPYVLE